MPRKRLQDDDPRRKRRALTLLQKGQVLDMLDRGVKVVDVASSFQVNESTIRIIRNNKEKIRQSLKVAAGDISKVVKQARNEMLIKVDKLLTLYVRRQKKAGIPVSREEVNRQVAEAVAIAHRLPGFDGVTAEGVMDMLRSQQPELSVEEMVEEADEEEREAEKEGGEGERGQAAAPPLMTAGFKELLTLGELFKDKLLELDDSMECAEAGCALITQVLEPYDALFSHYLNTRQQALITRYSQPLAKHNLPPPPDSDEEREVEEILEATEDDDVVSQFNFGGFESGEDSEAAEDSE